MSFVTRGRRRLGDITDFPGNFTNPDGTLTYDGQPYDPFDPNNPYAYSMPAVTVSAPSPGPLPVASTSFGWDTTIKSLTTPTPGLPTQPAIVASGLPTPSPISTSGLTSLVSSIGSLFGSRPQTIYGAPVPYGATPARTLYPTTYANTASTFGGISTSTLLLLAVGVGAAVLLGKKRA